MIDLSFKYKDLIKEVKDAAPFEPELSLVLGSGLGNFIESIDVKKSIKTSELTGYPPSTIEGHAGFIHFAEYQNKKLLIFQGRIHFYEGYKISECILPVFIAKKLNTKFIIITNAAGGVNPHFSPGDLMLASSLNGISIKKELTNLIGVANVKGRNNFNNFPSGKLNNTIKRSALEEKIDLKEGVYWYTKGPTYETPAEVIMAGRFGADAVGMSTVHEAVFAAYNGLETSVISLISNLAAGISKTKLSHEEVTETAKISAKKFENLLKRTITELN